MLKIWRTLTTKIVCSSQINLIRFQLFLAYLCRHQRRSLAISQFDVCGLQHSIVHEEKVYTSFIFIPSRVFVLVGVGLQCLTKSTISTRSLHYSDISLLPRRVLIFRNNGDLVIPAAHYCNTPTLRHPREMSLFWHPIIPTFSSNVILPTSLQVSLCRSTFYTFL